MSRIIVLPVSPECGHGSTLKECRDLEAKKPTNQYRDVDVGNDAKGPLGENASIEEDSGKFGEANRRYRHKLNGKLALLLSTLIVDICLLVHEPSHR